MPRIALPIESPSLRLRYFRADESTRLMELNAEPSTRRWLPSHVYADAAEAAARVTQLIAFCASPGDPRLGPYVLAVEQTATGALLGHVGFSPFESEVEVSYAIAESARGQRFGAEALQCACRWAAANFDLPAVIALTEAGNAPSRRTLERAEFVHEKDVVMKFQGRDETVSRYVWRLSSDSPDGCQP